MLTPRSKPCLLTRMKSRAGPWNQVAVIQPSSCHTVAKRSQSPASRHSTQFSITSRMACRSAASASLIPRELTRDPVAQRADAFDLGLDHVAVLQELLRRAPHADALTACRWR